MQAAVRRVSVFSMSVMIHAALFSSWLYVEAPAPAGATGSQIRVALGTAGAPAATAVEATGQAGDARPVSDVPMTVEPVSVPPSSQTEAVGAPRLVTAIDQARTVSDAISRPVSAINVPVTDKPIEQVSEAAEPVNVSQTIEAPARNVKTVGEVTVHKNIQTVEAAEEPTQLALQSLADVAANLEDLYAPAAGGFDGPASAEGDQAAKLPNEAGNKSAGGSPGGGEQTASLPSGLAADGTDGLKDAYFAALKNWLERHKRYPRRAKLRQQQGVVLLRFTVTPAGNVSDYSVAKSSGFQILDDEVQNLVHRAQPFPKIPPKIARGSLELLVPIDFTLR